ncbi:hypothetical protein GALL_471840 [mine drainage metagenome]|uniref:Uncharacterized protein n=1 Tax=mine drainage metagenome TaxID=410659 RepID=A0A1J5PK68_9ZZZZ
MQLSAIAGAISGRLTETHTRQRDAPDSRAASSRSVPSPASAPAMINPANGNRLNVCTNTNPPRPKNPSDSARGNRPNCARYPPGAISSTQASAFR